MSIQNSFFTMDVFPFYLSFHGASYRFVAIPRNHTAEFLTGFGMCKFCLEVGQFSEVKPDEKSSEITAKDLIFGDSWL